MEKRKQRFAELAASIRHVFVRDLFLDHAIEPNAFEALHESTRAYISACLGTVDGVLSESALLERLTDPLVNLPNKTPNGLLLPKTEVASHFMAVHKSFATIIEGLAFARLTDGWTMPINVRIVSGHARADVLKRPYAASKIHSDVWAGEPADSVVMNIPVFGDIARTSLEWLELPDELGESHLKLYSDFSDAEPVTRLARRIDLQPQLGHIYFSDCALLHRTLRLDGGCRVSLDLRFRFRSNSAARREAERLSGSSRLANYIPFDQWRRVGRDLVLVCNETMEQARRKYETAQSSYGSAPYRLAAKS